MPAQSEQSAGNPTFLDDLDRLERLFAGRKSPGRRALVLARKRARERALTVLETSGPTASGVRAALLACAAELFDGLGIELATRPAAAAELAQQIEEVVGLPRLAIAHEVLRSPNMLALPPAVAVEVQLALLLAFAPLRSASLWTLDAGSRLRCIRHVGDGSATRDARKLAQRLLAGETSEPGAGASLVGLAVERWQQQPTAALVARAEPGQRDRALVFLQEALPMLAAILERDTLLARNTASERTLVEASERKLTRLGFDLHDGPLQDLALLGEDLRLFRDQLEQVLGSRVEHKLLRGRVDDLEAQLVALETELRRLSNSVQAPVRLSQPFPQALRDITDDFAARTKIELALTLNGDLEMLSTSQQIALLNIAQEALSNVREHSAANEVTLSVAMEAAGVEAQIIDDGHGFDVERTLVSAARGGRLGLAGMYERVRLLGGQCRIDSRSGGPTVISVTIPRWEPLGEVVTTALRG
jgi:signal transduction histidine kinase